MKMEEVRFTSDGRVSMRAYLHDDEAERPAVVVCPGGAFEILAPIEGEPAALVFHHRGYDTFLLSYSIGDHSSYPAPLDDVCRAISTVRARASEWRVDARSIAVLGFSAGGAVANMAASQWNTEGLAERLGVSDARAMRPDAAVICYGAGDMHLPRADTPYSYGKIVEDRDPHLDVASFVGSHTPPMFIWHSRYDSLVSVRSALALAEAMQKHDRPYELHVFMSGDHAMGAGRNAPGVAPRDDWDGVDMWVDLCARWLASVLPCAPKK